MRTLDAQGIQLNSDIQWSAGQFDKGRLSFSTLEHAEGAGEPPVRPRQLLVSWSGFPDRVQRERLLVVLHRTAETPNTLDGVPMIPYFSGLIGAVIPWQRVGALKQVSRSAQLSLIDGKGRVVRSAPVDLSVLDQVLGATHAALLETRDKAASYAKSCDPVTEWMKL